MQVAIIRFYRESDNYGCFSNFSKHPVEIDGNIWKTSEHYFQAMKFAGTSAEEKIRNASSPTIAKKLGRKYKLRSDWEQIKDNIMYKVVLAKFSQNENIRRVLLNTNNATLIEHTANDSYWGDGGDGTGKNMLGKILMKVRKELKKQLN